MEVAPYTDTDDTSFCGECCMLGATRVCSRVCGCGIGLALVIAMGLGAKFLIP